MSKLIIAGAGTGKTTYLVQKALSLSPSPILITTYTEANESNIKETFYRLNGFIPPNVTILTWFSFLIAHGIKPYKSYLITKPIHGISIVPSNEEKIRYLKESDERKYISESGKLYSVSLSKGVCKIDEKSKGRVFKRISNVFSYIFIDEVQDLSGYDLEIVAKLSKSNCEILLVGDPRQATYQTHDEAKNKKYSYGKIENYIRDKKLPISIDCDTLSETFRCHPDIIELSNLLYPSHVKTFSNRRYSTGHDGVFWINQNIVEVYINTYQPVLLRYSKQKEIEIPARVYNFGNSKGLTFDRTLIYPTKPMNEWFSCRKPMNPVPLAKFYVAITRARYSVGIVFSGLFPPSEEFGTVWDPQSNWD